MAYRLYIVQLVTMEPLKLDPRRQCAQPFQAAQKEAVKEKAMRAKANADLLAVVASHLAPLC